MAGEGELNRVIKDLQKTVAELKCSYQEQNLPVTDGSRELHSLCAQLEFLLQFDLKEKRSFFGQRKDYWDFLCQGLARCRQEHEGIHFVTSLDKLKTPVGRGRAFLRYCLVHRQLAESLQLCLLDPESLCEWYYARSPFLSPKQRAEILGSLYELDCVTFHLALHRSDLDTAWPMFSEPLVRPSPVIRSSPAKTALQTDRIGTVAHGWSDGIGCPTVALHGAPAHLCPRPLAALQGGSVEVGDTQGDVQDGEVKKDIEEEDEEDVEKDDIKDTKEVKVEDLKVEDLEVNVEKDMEEDLEEKHEELEEVEKEMKDVDVEELEDAHGTGKAAQPDGAGEPGMSTGTRCMPGSLSLVPRQPGGTEESLQALVSQLRAELGQREAAAQALAARLARADLRHRRQEEGSARRAQLWAREAEALRETNTFLERALEAAVAAGDLGALARAQEEARGWKEVAEERGTQLARVLAEAAALTSRLQECQEALVAAGRTDMLKDAGTSNEVAAVEEVLRQALELARGPQEPPRAPQAEGEHSTVTSMAMHLASLAATAQEETWQSRQQLQAQRQEMARLQEELSRARQDGERWASALQRAQREALEREATRGAEQARQQELIRDMKERLLELLREKDALWQKTEGIDTPMPSPVPRDPGLCARCHKDFRLLSRRYNCRLCQGKVCHTCSVDMGKHGRCCLICYQQRHPQAT
ncbi:RUN and FYVE domain-containing protein 4 [Lonchura striata]|uniref:RUN and FYVE domain-containing protein 4 n=1 Tax=Lonchura striata TaxID=40157 RepID=A0A218VC71_9PASE|nr:RUN and FYVE domain-containing protein 4 [Lonchura striata domestica]OWK63172.1 RUN and FYVE domain-containing protein 4 [Lonchura striata domestica]